MPILMTSAPMSPITTSICWRMKSGGTGITPCTPRVFCAVSAVIAVAAKAPSAVTVLMSAWMPAPPPESEPAMTSTRPRITASLLAGLPPAASSGHLGDRSRTANRRPRPPARSSSPSAITRTSGSVPLSRINTRPLPPRRASASRIAACTRGFPQRRDSGETHVLQPLRQRLEHPQDLGGGAILLHQHAPAPAIAASSPSPVVAKSDRIRWPDCSPPTLIPIARMCSAT